MVEHVFMSYARSDGAEMAEALYQDMINSSINVWLDKYSIVPGKDWDREIDNGLSNAFTLLVLLTPGSVLSTQVKSEWNYALNKHIPVIPLLIVTCNVPRTLSVFNWIDFRPDYEAALQLLLVQLQELPNNHYQHLVTTLEAYQSAQEDATHPERFTARIESLQEVIVNWDKFQINQDVRIVAELRDVRAQAYKDQVLSKSIKSVGRKPYDIFDMFKDRTIVREQIRAMLFDSTTKLVSLIGRGGMGKTATVSKVLNDIENHRNDTFSVDTKLDGIIYLGARTEEITLEKILGNVVNLFENIISDDLHQIISNSSLSDEEKLTQLFEQISNRKFIILLDNLEDIQDEEGRILNEQIELFIKIFLTTDFNGTLLVTSRVPLQLDQSLMQYDQRIPLVDGIPKEDAIELLYELDPHGHFGLRDSSTEDISNIVDLTHAVPRSLEVIASMLANDPFLSINELTSGAFSQEVNALSLVQEMYRRLDRDALTLIEVLAVFGRPVASVGIDYVLDKYAPNIDVRSKLRFLTVTHTVTINRAEKTVTLHPIDRDFIYGNLCEVKPDQLKIIEQLAADYYDEISTSPDVWQTIDDLQNSIYEFGHRINAEEYERARQLLISLDNDHLFKWGNYKRLISMYDELQGHFIPSKELAQVLDRVARILARMGNSQQSIIYVHQALDMIPQGVLRNNLLNTLGSAYVHLGQFEDALSCYEQGISNARVRNDRNQEAHFLAQIGFAYYNLANNKNMLEAYNDSMKIAKEINDIDLEKTLLGYLSKGYSQLGQFEEMLIYAQQALEITRTLGDRYEECMRLSDLGDGSLRLGRFTDAIKYLNDAMEIAEELNAISAIGYRAWLLGWSYIGNQQYQKAKSFLIRALDIGKELGNPHLIQRSAYHLCHVHILDNQFDLVKSILADVPIRNGVLRTKYHLSLLEGFLAQRDGNLSKAEADYRYTLECIEEIIAESPDFLEVWYDKPIALAGIALVDPGNAKSHVELGIKALEHGLDLAVAKGILVDSELMLRLLSGLDSENDLADLITRIEDVLKS